MIRVIVASVFCCLAVIAACDSLAAKPSKARVQAVEEQAPVDACKPTTWRSIGPETVAQMAKLIEQYNAANDQLAKLGASDSDTVIISRRKPATGYKVYEGDWNEVREALQSMLKARLASLDCKLQALHVDMRQVKIQEISRR